MLNCPVVSEKCSFIIWFATVAELAELCEFGPRSIKRDIAMLKEEFHVPICDRGRFPCFPCD